MSIMRRFKESFDKAVKSVEKAVNSVRESFGGGGRDDRPGSTRIPGGRSIISDGRSLLPPDSTFSDRPAVQSNLDAERRRAGQRFFTPPGVKEKKDRDRDPPPPPPPPAPEPEPVAEAPAAPPPSPVGDSGMTVAQEDRIEEAGETAAEKQKKLGLAQTIATSPRGLLAGGEGTTRRRRSLMGGGIIV